MEFIRDIDRGTSIRPCVLNLCFFVISFLKVSGEYQPWKGQEATACSPVTFLLEEQGLACHSETTPISPLNIDRLARIIEHYCICQVSCNAAAAADLPRVTGRLWGPVSHEGQGRWSISVGKLQHYDSVRITILRYNESD